MEHYFNSFILAWKMLKLYKLFDGERHYWETWEENEQTGIMHWGKVGEIGQSKEVKSGFLSEFRAPIQKEIAQKLLEGYAEIESAQLSVAHL